MTDLRMESAVDEILRANAQLLEDGPYRGGTVRMDQFLQCEGLEPARMCLLRGLSQRIRDRLLLQNMILHLAGLPSHAGWCRRRGGPGDWTISGQVMLHNGLHGPGGHIPWMN